MFYKPDGEIFDFPSREPEGIFVKVKKNNVEGALKVLKKKMLREGLIKDMRKKEYYVTGTEKRKRRKIEARIRWLRKKKQLDNEWWNFRNKQKNCFINL